MFSFPVVHPVEVAAPPTVLVEVPPGGVFLSDIPGMPGTVLGFALRFFQLFLASMSIYIMTSVHEFVTVSAFWYDLPRVFSFAAPSNSSLLLSV